MTRSLKLALLGACLATLLTQGRATPEGGDEGGQQKEVQEEEQQQQLTLVEEGRKLLTPEIQGVLQPLKGMTVPVVIAALLIIGVILLFYEFARGIERRLNPHEEEEERKDYAYYDYDYHEKYYNSLPPQEFYEHRPHKRSVPSGGSFFNQVVNSIDPVDLTFNVLQVRSPSCRGRSVCELQKEASKIPLLGYFLQRASLSVQSLDRYREAQDAGAALEDCALLFSECPVSSLWGSDEQQQ